MWHSYIFRKGCKFWHSELISCQKRCSKIQKIWHQNEASYGQQISSHMYTVLTWNIYSLSLDWLTSHSRGMCRIPEGWVKIQKVDIGGSVASTIQPPIATFCIFTQSSGFRKESNPKLNHFQSPTALCWDPHSQHSITPRKSSLHYTG